MKNFSVYWLPVLVYMSLIFYLSSQSQIPIEVPWWFFYWDKFAHAGLFGGLAFLFLRAYLNGTYSSLTGKAGTLTLLFTSLYGASDEMHQMFVPGRTPSLGDWAADTVGAMLVCVLCLFWNRFYGRKDMLESNG